MGYVKIYILRAEFLKLFDKRICVVRKQKVGHILDADNVGAHIFEGLCKLDKVFLIVNWAYGAMPLNNGNVGTIYYAAAYYQIEGIKNPTNPEYAPYTAEEIAAIVDGAVEGAEGYRFDVPAGALIGVTVADTDTVYWYDAEAAAAIVGHPDPLTLNAETGEFVTVESIAVATPIK